MTTPLPFGSLLLRDMLSTAPMREIWGEERMLDAWMTVERAFTEAMAERSAIPAEAAREIVAHLTRERLTPDLVAKRKETTGHLMVSFLQAFREVCGPAAEHLHVGLTTQDVLDTALVLQMRDAHERVLASLDRLEEVLCDRALRHRHTVMMGRSHQQHAVPLTLGFVLAGWAGEMHDHGERLREGARRWQCGSFCGAVGANNALVELLGAEGARSVQESACRKLRLAAPPVGIHARTDRFAEVVSTLSLLCGSLAKIGADLAAAQRTEVGELEEPYGPEQHWSSTMPNKRNPETNEHLQGLAALCRGYAVSAQELRVAEVRDATRMPIELSALPMSYLVTDRALEIATRNVSELVVNEDRMRHNLAHPNELGHAAAERVLIALYRKTGRRDAAHALLHRCSQRARESGQAMRSALLAEPEIRRHFRPEELDRLLDLSTYTGAAADQTERAIRDLRLRRERSRRSRDE